MDFFTGLGIFVTLLFAGVLMVGLITLGLDVIQMAINSIKRKK